MKQKTSFNRIYIYILCGLLIVLLGALCLPDTIVGREEREQALRKECAVRMQKLAAACLLYAKCNNGAFPADVMRTRGVAEQLVDQGFLKDRTVMLCPSTRTRYPRSSFFFIPGVRANMSPKMPCVLEKITNHDRMIGVIYVDGTVDQLEHEFQNYPALISLFPNITPEEKRLLETHLKRLDIP